MRLIIPDPVDAILWHEHLDINGPGAFKSDGIELIVLEHDKVPFGTFITLDLVFLSNRIAGHGIHVTTDDTVARLAVKSVKSDLPFLRGCWRHRHRTCHKRKLQIALPKCARCHGSSHQISTVSTNLHSTRMFPLEGYPRRWQSIINRLSQSKCLAEMAAHRQPRISYASRDAAFARSARWRSVFSKTVNSSMP